MHRKQGAKLLPLDTEIERTLKDLRKVKSAEIAEMADERFTGAVNQAEVPQERDTMEDFWRPVIQDEYSVLRQPAIDANNFELKPVLITMVQQNQFTGHPSEDSNEHLGRFLRMANTVKLNGVRPEVIKLQLFPFSLKDIAASWFDSLPYGSVNTWEELMEAYLSRFFPPSLTSERRGEITTFKQGEDESMYTAWERYKRLLKKCPMHRINLKTQMDIFYHSMNYTSKGIIDAACGEAFRRRRAEEARQLIEDLARCNMRPPSESSGSIIRAKGNGMIELNKMSAMEAKEKSEKDERNKGERILENAESPGKEMKKEQQQEEERSKKKAQNSMPAVPFLQRLQKSRIEEQFAKFLKTFQKLEISMPFTEVVTQMPLYAKFLKEILSKKRRFAKEGVVNLTATCSAVIKKNLPEKMKDPGSFTIPCTIGGFEIQKALCDSGASINLMPLSVARKLSLGELTPTVVTLQMAGRTMAKPEGVIEDVLVKVGKFVFPVDFIILDIE